MKEASNVENYYIYKNIKPNYKFVKEWTDIYTEQNKRFKKSIYNEYKPNGSNNHSSQINSRLERLIQHHTPSIMHLQKVRKKHL